MGELQHACAYLQSLPTLHAKSVVSRSTIELRPEWELTFKANDEARRDGRSLAVAREVLSVLEATSPVPSSTEVGEISAEGILSPQGPTVASAAPFSTERLYADHGQKWGTGRWKQGRTRVTVRSG